MEHRAFFSWYVIKSEPPNSLLDHDEHDVENHCRNSEGQCKQCSENDAANVLLIDAYSKTINIPSKRADKNEEKLLEPRKLFKTLNKFSHNRLPQSFFVD